MIGWLLNHPSRFSWIACEFLRPLPWRRRLSNAWWQVRHYNDKEAFREVVTRHRAEWDALVRASERERPVR